MLARTFGIEIEFAGDRTAVQTALADADIPVVTGDYSSFDARRWTVKTDGSVYNGGEVCSWPMEFDNPSHRLQVREVVKAMRDEAECGTTEQAGIHVHVGVEGFTDYQIAELTAGCLKFEDTAYRLASSGWETIRSNATEYAHPFRRETKNALIIADFAPDVVRDQCTDRYNMVNIGNYIAGGASRRSNNKLTVEFRLFNTSLNPDRVDSFISYAVGMTRAAYLRKFTATKLDRYTCFPLGGMVAGVRNETLAIAEQLRMFEGGVLHASDIQRIKHFTEGAAPQPSFGGSYDIPGWLSAEPEATATDVATPTWEVAEYVPPAE